MNEDQYFEFEQWWDVVGSGIAPLAGEDQETHARRVAYQAYLACLEDNGLDE